MSSLMNSTKHLEKHSTNSSQTLPKKKPRELGNTSKLILQGQDYLDIDTITRNRH